MFGNVDARKDNLKRLMKNDFVTNDLGVETKMSGMGDSKG